MSLPIASAPPRSEASSQPLNDAVRINAIVSEWVAGLSHLAISAQQSPTSVDELQASIEGLFLENGYWRDLVCLSWDFRNLSGPAQIAKYLSEGNRLRSLEFVTVDKRQDRQARDAVLYPPSAAGGPIFGIQVLLELQLSAGRSGTGMLQLARDKDESWKAYFFTMALDEIKGHEPRINEKRVTHLDYGYETGRKFFGATRHAELEMREQEPAVVVIGAGHAGLMVAAHLTHMGVRALVVEQNGRVGDSWRQRYGNLVLHDPIIADRLPYMSYPETWPLFTPKEKFGDFLESYAKLLDLNVWTDSTVASAEFDETKKRWTVTINRNRSGSSPETRTLQTNHIVMATGVDGTPRLPSIAGIETFKGKHGTGPIHSANTGETAVAGPGDKVIIVGMGNSAVDIAQGCWENGAEVTMVQRGPTYVFRRDSLVKYMYEPNFYKMTPKTEYETDLAMIASPMAVRLSRSIALTQMMKKEDAELLGALDDIGFQISYGPDGTGLIGIVTERKHPYVNDTGCLQLLAEKKIGLQTGGISRITENSVVMENGTTLEADHLVVATGYQGISASIKEILGDKVFSKMKKPLIMDEEGEMQCNWRPTGHDRFWLGAHPVLFARSSSKLLALQILGIELGLNK